MPPQASKSKTSIPEGAPAKVNGGGVITVKQLGWVVGVFASCAVLFSVFVVPAMLAEASAQTIDSIDRHNTGGPHPAAVGREEWKIVLQRLDTLATKDGVEAIRRDLVDIKARMRDLEQRR